MSPHSWLAERVAHADVLCALEKRVPILCLSPRLEVVKGDVGEFAAERGAIDGVADAVEPLVHPHAVLAHALADDVERHLVVGEGAAGDAREYGDDVAAREVVAAEIEALSDRWRVVPLLLAETSYREIHDRTGVSVTTIGRIARSLSFGAGGYGIAAERVLSRGTRERERERGSAASKRTDGKGRS